MLWATCSRICSAGAAGAPAVPSAVPAPEAPESCRRRRRLRRMARASGTGEERTCELRNGTRMLRFAYAVYVRDRCARDDMLL